MLWRRARKIKAQIDPDTTFLDSSNLPSFDTQQFEGRIEQPVRKLSFSVLGLCCFFVALLFIVKVGQLQIVNGQSLAERSRSNTLRHTPIFAERGIITDRNQVELSWNNNGRKYKPAAGLAHLVGYIGYPNEAEMASGDHHPQEMVGRDGAEGVFNDLLRGQRGTRIEEVDVKGEIKSDYILDLPVSGENLNLSIDSRLQEKLHQLISALVEEGRFQAGAGVIMDVKTGELISLVSAPEYDPAVLTEGKDRAKISAYINSASHPFLNRPLLGLYTPGSVVKPFMALAALTEGVITPEKKILSTGALSVPNPYVPGEVTVFKDWRAHGWTNLREAISVSSDVYFYQIGGGYEDQPGLGISRIEEYMRYFGFGAPTGIDFLTEAVGVIPNPEWKKKNFAGEDWYLGNTYHTAIGQYGFQITPLQLARGIAAIANDGRLPKPTVLRLAPDMEPTYDLVPEVKTEYYQIVREGMRLGVESGTAAGLNTRAVEVAGKTGTAELGISKGQVNSWVTGFWPYRSPRYAFAVVMEAGDRGNTIGGVYVMRQFFDWLAAAQPEYLSTN